MAQPNWTALLNCWCLFLIAKQHNYDQTFCIVRHFNLHNYNLYSLTSHLRLYRWALSNKESSETKSTSCGIRGRHYYCCDAVRFPRGAFKTLCHRFKADAVVELVSRRGKGSIQGNWGGYWACHCSVRWMERRGNLQVLLSAWMRPAV